MTAIATEIDVTLVVYFLQYLLYHLLVALFGSSYELVVLNMYGVPGTAKFTAYDVGVFLGCGVVVMCGFHDLVTMFIGACKKKGIVTCHGIESLQEISQYCCVGMPYMWFCVHVIDGCCYIKPVFHGVPRKKIIR